MHKKNHSFTYYLAWLIIGLFLGAIFLLMRGDIDLSVKPSVKPVEQHDEAATHASSDEQNKHEGFADAVVKAAPAVVSIQTITWKAAEPAPSTEAELLKRFLGKNSPHRPKRRADKSAGSGVIVRSDGYILTNYHVVAKRDLVVVRLSDGREIRAQLIGSDPETDLAVLKIEAKNLPTLAVADISQVRVGDIVLAIGDPFSIGQTVTQGIISATGRTSVTGNTYENFIQTDAAINPGNSGGALINTLGEIVGINSNIYSSTGNFQGISFAIPIDLAHTVAEQIIQNGYVVRGWLGVEGQEINPQVLRTLELDSLHGVLITSVDIDGPGDRAGLKNGDIITRINDQETTSVNDVLNIVAAGKPGDVFEIEGIRQRQSFVTRATLGQRPLMSR